MREVHLIVKGYNNRVIGQYKQTRLLMFMMARMWGDGKKVPSSPEAFWPLPGDEVGRMSDDEIKDILKAVHAGRATNNGFNG